MNKLLSNLAICLSKFRFGKCFFNGFSHLRIYFLKSETVNLWEIFSLKKVIHDLLGSHNFFKFGKKR